MKNEFSTKSYGTIFRVDPWPTMGTVIQGKRKSAPLPRTPVLVRRAGVIVRELVPPARSTPFDAA